MLENIGGTEDSSDSFSHLTGLMDQPDIERPSIYINPDIRESVYHVGQGDYSSDNCEIMGKEGLRSDIRRAIYDSGYNPEGLVDEFYSEVEEKGDLINGGDIKDVLKQNKGLLEKEG